MKNKVMKQVQAGMLTVAVAASMAIPTMASDLVSNETVSENEISVVESSEESPAAEVESDSVQEDTEEDELVGAGKVNMYRLYNPNSGEHFYTSKTGERDQLARVGWQYEGIGWVAPSSGDAVYRLYNPNAGDHHYTLNLNEVYNLMIYGWRYEGIGWYSATSKSLPVYRQYNRNAKSGSHNFTTSWAENNSLVRAGWKAEGVAWYAVGKGKTIASPNTGYYGAPNGFINQPNFKAGYEGVTGEYHRISGGLRESFIVFEYTSAEDERDLGVMYEVGYSGKGYRFYVTLRQVTWNVNLYKVMNYPSGQDSGMRITFYRENGTRYAKLYDNKTNNISLYRWTKDIYAG